MAPPTIRLLPIAVADGPANMAADETLLQSAAVGVASLRFYGWQSATVSLGYFQSLDDVRKNPRLAELPFVRRPSGGNTLVHHYEVTYCLTLPARVPWQTAESWLGRMHGIIATALAMLGIRAQLHEATTSSHAVLCFQQFTPGDVRIGSAKVVGSAQRKQRGALMQHGGILLAQSPHTPELPGIHELTGRTLGVEETCTAIAAAFTEKTGWNLLASDWTAEENLRKEELRATKYTQESWNRKR